MNCTKTFNSDYAKVYFFDKPNKYWKSSDNKYAIWFDDKQRNWKIGLSENYGTSTFLMHSIGQDIEEHNSPIGKSWMCWNGQDLVEDDKITVKNDPGKLNLAKCYGRLQVKCQLLSAAFCLMNFQHILENAVKIPAFSKICWKFIQKSAVLTT